MNRERMRSVLEALARTFTERNDISVTWGAGPCTDFKRIYLPRRNEIVPGVECSPGELWLSLKASCAHESGHLVFTDKGVWDKFKEKPPIYRHILNIIEDARVERSMSNSFPGTLRWFRFNNEYVFLNRSDWMEMAPPGQALYGLVCYAVVGRIPEGLPEDGVKFVSECAPLVDEGRTSETTEGAAGASEEIAKVFLKYFGSYAPSAVVMFSPETQGTYEPRKSPGGDRDPRRKPVLPKIESKPKAGLEPETEIESGKKIASKEERREAKSVEDAIENKPDAEPNNDTEPGDAEGDNKLDNDFSSEEDAPAEDEPDVDVETDDGVEGSDDFSLEEDASDPDDEEDEGGSPDKSNTGPEDDECIPGGDQETVSKSDGPEAGNSDGDQKENPDEAPDGSSDVETQSDPEDADESGEEEVSPGGDAEDEPEPGDTPEESLEEDLLTGMDDLLEESEKETRSFREEPPEKPAPEYSREEVEEAARAGMMKSRLVVQKLPPDPKRRERYEKNLKPLAHRAAEEVRKILESRHSIIRRNLRKGALDPSALWKVPVREPDIFRKRDLPGRKADLAVYLLIDCSGSMRSYAESRWPDCRCSMDYAACAAILLHLMCRELNVPHAATGFTTQRLSSYEEKVLHLRVKKFSERHGSFESLFSNEFRNVMRNNVDGYSVRAAAKELSIRPEKQKVLFVISDGLPEAYGYEGTPAFKDTALAVREAERSGIGVIGVYIGESDSTVKLLYPNLIMLSAGDLPVVLARTLKKVITGPA